MLAAPFRRQMNVRSFLRRLVETFLPWYDAVAEAEHDRHTEEVRQRAIAQRIKVEKVIAEYRAADERARRNRDYLIEAYRAADDERHR